MTDRQTPGEKTIYLPTLKGGDFKNEKKTVLQYFVMHFGNLL